MVRLDNAPRGLFMPMERRVAGAEGESIMTYCTRCGSRLVDGQTCLGCGARRYSARRSAPTEEHPPAGDLPAFVFAYAERTLLNLVERQRQVRVPFSYISGTVSDIQTHEDAGHPFRIGVWSQEDDPATGPQSSIVGHEWQPSRHNVISLRLGSGAERSFVLKQVRFAARAGDRITRIFPVAATRMLNPFYDYAAIGAVNYGTSDQRWSTAHAEIHQVRERLPSSESKRFLAGLANHLDGLCLRCLRLFNPYRRSVIRKPTGAAHEGLRQ
jgi:hypothetical protein